MQKSKGFTLIELMIVVSIIAIIASLAIPNLLRARLAANEASAIGGLRAICSGEHAFQSSTGADFDVDGIGEYGTLFMLSAAGPSYIDDNLASGSKSGYFFLVTTTGVINMNEIIWEGTAYPMNKGNSGNRTFYIDESGVIRASDMGGPTGVPGVPATRVMAAPSAGGNFPPLGN